jgi:RNA polymerase sigma-70 factor (ECF subfamily)
VSGPAQLTYESLIRDNESDRIRAARAGCGTALGELLESCRHYLLAVGNEELDPGLAAKVGVSDLVQDTFLDAQRDFHGFQGLTRTELLAWLRRILLNNLLNQARRYHQTVKRQLSREVSLQAGSNSGTGANRVAASTSSPSRILMDQEEAVQLEKALQRLSREQREVIFLRNQLGLSFVEIGAQTQRSADAARHLWARGIERLQQELESTRECA